MAGSSGKRLAPSRPTKDPPDLTHHGSLPPEQAQPALGLLASSQLYHLDLCLSLAPDNQQKSLVTVSAEMGMGMLGSQPYEVVAQQEKRNLTPLR